MALHKKGKYYYGDSQPDIRDELLRYSKLNEYQTVHYADAKCVCGNNRFSLSLDEDEGAAIRQCVSCKTEHPIADSIDFLQDAKLETCECICGSKIFEITVGVSLYENSEDVKWLYVGCRCVNCELTGCYGDWKNEYNGFRDLLNRV